MGNSFTSLFNEHLFNCISTNDYFPFVVHGVRYVRCDFCKEIVPVDDCCYFGGEDVRILCGVCVSCFRQQS